MDNVKLTKQEATRAANKRYYELHRNQVLEKNKQYKLKHQDTKLNYHREYNKKYYELNKTKIIRQIELYRIDNADTIREYYRQRYINKKCLKQNQENT